MPRFPATIPWSSLKEVTPDIPAEVLTQEFGDASERLDLFIGALALELATDIELPSGRVEEPEVLVARRGWSSSAGPALRWLFETLESYGYATPTPSGFLLELAVPSRSSAAIRDDTLSRIPGAEPAYRLLELCAAALPAILAGEKTGEELLAGPAALGMWLDYFSNRNPHYALNNTLTALAVGLLARPGAAIVEVGGGGGSAAEAILTRLAQQGKAPATYTFTEVHPAFLRRGTRVVQSSLPAGTTLCPRQYDINCDPASQAMATASADLVVAVNTIHLATRLVDTLCWLRSLLRPGGSLVLGELMRPSAESGVHLELPFSLLEAYRAAPMIPGTRSRPGFLALAGWQRALREAGFSELRTVPEQYSRCCELYPGFYCAALIAESR